MLLYSNLNTHCPSPGDHARKPLYFHPSCEKDYKTLPEDVQADAGYNLDLVQQGKAPEVSFGPMTDNLKTRSRLMSRLDDYLREKGFTQEEAADQLDVPQSRISFLLNGKISKFTIDYLLNMCTRTGIEVDVTFRGSRAADPPQ